MPSIALTMSLRGQLLSSTKVTPFSPSTLFAANEPGVWYDPSDLTTMFQDTAGTTPVTTPGQSVALVLDKSKGLTLGSELVTNGDFSSATGWTLGAGWTIGGGVASANIAAGVNLDQSITTTINKTYQVTYTITNYTSGGIRARFTGAANISGTVRSAAGTYTELFHATATNSIFRMVDGGGGFVGTIDNISVRELPGFHATQATAASRPIYARNPITGTRNLLTYTEQFDNAAWTKGTSTVSPNAAVAPDGTTTADKIIPNNGSSNSSAFQVFSAAASTAYTWSCYLKAAELSLVRFRMTARTGANAFISEMFVDADLASGTIGAVTTGTFTATAAVISNIGGGWYRVVLTGTTPATTGILWPSLVYTPAGNGTNGWLSWGAQLETGSTATAYQKVVSQYDVTESGVTDAYYLAFDGVDDFLVTPTITPGIDKAQVFAGVRKLSDATAGNLVESSASWFTNNGAFSIGNPATSDGFGNGYFVAARANSPSITVRYATTYSAPITNVVSALFDLAASAANDKLTARVNGAAPTLSNASAIGTGNFLAYPLYIGRRGGVQLPFNGRIYSLITRFGANLTNTQITNTETWVNSKTGAY